jgi:hypothetical protein
MRLSLLKSAVLAAGIAAAGCGGTKGKETPLSALDEKTMSLGVYWLLGSSGSASPEGSVGLTLRFSDVGKMEGDACPIVRASATFGDVSLPQNGFGGAARCSVNDGPECDQECMDVGWVSTNMAPLLGNLPETVDVVVKDGNEIATSVVHNAAPMATATMLDFSEGQEMHNGDSLRLQIQARPPATIEDIQDGVFVEVLNHFSVSVSRDPESGPDIWKGNISPQSTPAGRYDLVVGYANSNLQFDVCPPGFSCSGRTHVQFGRFAFKYVP